jgi:Holliday junction resolvase
MPRESVIVASIIKTATGLGWWAKKLHGNQFQVGLPDVLCIKNGVAAFMEVKQPGRKPTKLQAHQMEEIMQKGGAPCCVVTSKEAAAAFLSLVQP